VSAAPERDPALAGGRLTVNLDALADNWRLLRDRSSPAECAAAVKANGYGLGIGPVVQSLWDAGCKTFFVALADEGLQVRSLLPQADIYVLNGLFTGAADDLAQADLRPVLGSVDEVYEWAAFCKKRDETLAAAVHMDTGMNRLGLSAKETDQLTRRPDLLRPFTPTLLMSHLACADDPSHPLNERQLAAFNALKTDFPDMPASLANSAGILTRSDWYFDMVRPGIALYGGEAVAGSPNPMAPVATLESRIIQVRNVAVGETVGYGATQTLQRDSRIALLSCGYADGYHRLASSNDPNPGAVAWLDGHIVPLVGRVSMDLIAVDVTDLPDGLATRGAWVELFGANIAVDDVAKQAGTIGYELLTGLGSRLSRRYITSAEAS